jgi:hypothetical protein
MGSGVEAARDALVVEAQVRSLAPQLVTKCLQNGIFCPARELLCVVVARRSRYDEAQVREAVANSCSLTDALRRLELRPAGGNHQTLKRLIDRYGISTDHFRPDWVRRGPRSTGAIPLDQVLVEGSTYSRKRLKQRLYESGLKERHCELCGQGETWHGRSMALILDHINGVPNDNRLENLRTVCPNCAATLDTHCGRNNRAPRRCARCGAEFRPAYESQRYCSRACGVRSPGPTRPRPDARKVVRPSHAELREDVRSMSICAVGRKYGVSDNAIRKWLRWYEQASQGGQEEAA